MRAAGSAEIRSAAILSREEVLRSGRAYWALRRSQDIFFSALALIVLLPLMLIVALIIVIDSPGAGPIFTQTRVGRDGRCRFHRGERWRGWRCRCRGQERLGFGLYGCGRGCRCGRG